MSTWSFAGSTAGRGLDGAPAGVGVDLTPTDKSNARFCVAGTANGLAVLDSADACRTRCAGC